MTSYDALPDDALVARLRDRDARALETLYDRHARLVFSLAVRMLGDVSAAEEIVQEVFVKVWRHPERYDATRGAFRTWLVGVTHHRSVDELRVRRADSARRATTLDDDAMAIPDPSADPADVAWATIQQDAVRRALSELPPEQRTAIELAYFKGLTHAEIATTLNEPLGTVKTRVRLGMQKLRAALEAERIWAEIR